MKGLRKKGLLLLLLVMMIPLVACGNGKENGESPNSGYEDNVEITLYYVNNEYIMSGSESLETILPVKKMVAIGDDSIEELVVSELQSDPDEEGLSTALSDIEILGVETIDSLVYVNISSENLSGSSLTESLLLQQLIYSLTEIPGIEAVQVLVDGEVTESLMGHILIEEPLTRE
ncbi:MAG: GerMN domain-containing protein [Anaerovoracaceae bacterium]|jgi:spore germination protein GerM